MERDLRLLAFLGLLEGTLEMLAAEAGRLAKEASQGESRKILSHRLQILSQKIEEASCRTLSVAKQIKEA